MIGLRKINQVSILIQCTFEKRALHAQVVREQHAVIRILNALEMELMLGAVISNSIVHQTLIYILLIKMESYVHMVIEWITIQTRIIQS